MEAELASLRSERKMMERRLNKSEADKADMARRIDDLCRSLELRRQRAQLISARAVRHTQFSDELLPCVQLTSRSD